MMATFNSKIHLVLYLYTLIVSPLVNPLNFSYNGYSDIGIISMPKPDSGNSSIDGDGVIELTTSAAGQHINGSCGWISYIHPVPLKNPQTNQQAMFSTHFSFIINANVTKSPNSGGDGLAFYMSPYPHTPASNSSGGHLCVFADDGNIDFSTNQVVAIEFDTYKNKWDPNDHHVGINVESIVSVVNYTLDDVGLMKYSSTKAYAWITYDTQTLSVYHSYDTARPDEPILSYPINLTILPNEVAVGFSAATGNAVELHQILTWDFNSTLDIEENISPSPSPSPSSSPSPSPSPSPSYYPSHSRLVLLYVVLFVIGLVIILVALVWLLLWRKKVLRGNAEVIIESDDSSPKSYTYKSLENATENFSEANKLGEGGFGPVFRGVLKDRQCEDQVAVKRVNNSKGLKGGLEEYKSEVKVLSRLNHRNLVKLKGWCEEKGDLLLVYTFMPNGCLNSQLYNTNRLLSWPKRYNIALGLASALNYLHEECENYILHRDIKPGNVLLDSQFNAKLSDFGLSRLVDHNQTSKITRLAAGTYGYLAPEYSNEGRASKESDVYSFGVVLLEMACGRRPFGQKYGDKNLIEFVWDHYGRQEVLQAADKRINGEYNEQQMECVLVVGLWCVHPNRVERPKISEAITTLKFSTPLPNIPSTMP